MRRQFVTLAWFRVALASGLGGCLLVDYEVDPAPPRFGDEVPSVDDDEAASEQSGDEVGAWKRDGGQRADATTGLPGSDPSAGQPQDDAVVGGDAGSARPIACPSTVNACGGCTMLSNVVGEACGSCGVGRFVCAGPEAVACFGGDALPSASGGRHLIDDFEDGDEFIGPEGGLSGAWYTTADATLGVLSPAPGSKVVPTEPGALGSALSVRMFGGGYTEWGAGLAVSLNSYGCSYDAALQDGIAFYARGTGMLTVSLATRQTVPITDGGTCFTGCYDNFSTSFPLSSEWRLYTLPWTSLRQAGWGTPALLSASQLRYIQFGFGPSLGFDLYADDLSFY